ncbi:MAG: hypothetical protein JWL63_2115 [Rhodocyclales bacterium]|nr:hypothetical protein [Rhodocyclales bacterium]
MNSLLLNILTDRVQIIAATGSAGLLFVIIRLIQKRRLREEYALLWIAVSILFAVISFFTPLLEMLAKLAGIIYAPSALLLFLCIGIILILIHYSIVISRLSDQNKKLIQDLALLKNRLGIGYEQEKP